MDDVAKYQPLAAEASAARASHSSANYLTIREFVYSVLLAIAIQGIAMALFMPPVDFGPKPRFFARLVEVQGLDLDPCVPEARSPVFVLSLHVDQVSESTRGPCAGGGDDAILRVSYHGTTLAWGGVPRFCVDGTSLQQRRPGASVATVVATAEGFVILEDLRKLIRAETGAFGRAEFDVDGSLPGLGRLHCKTYLFQGEPTKALPPCSLQRIPDYM